MYKIDFKNLRTKVLHERWWKKKREWKSWKCEGSRERCNNSKEKEENNWKHKNVNVGTKKNMYYKKKKDEWNLERIWEGSNK